VRRIDGVRRVEQTPADGLLDDIVDDVFEVGEKPVNRVSGWRFVEPAVVPDQSMMKFSCDRTCAVYILVVAVENAAKEVWWLVNTCSSPLRGGEHVVL